MLFSSGILCEIFVIAGAECCCLWVSNGSAFMLAFDLSAPEQCYLINCCKYVVVYWRTSKYLLMLFGARDWMLERV